MSDMTMPEAQLLPPIPTKEAERLALELFGLKAMAKRLPGEYDDNFHLRADFGDEFVLKVMHPARERELVDLQCEALQWLYNMKCEHLVPHVIRTRNGAKFGTATVLDGTCRLVWMLTFISGRVLAENKPHSPELLEALGRMLGDIDHALERFRHPAAKRELKWDSAQAGWIRDYFECMPDRKGREIVSAFLQLYDTEVVPRLPQLRRSVIYGDANDYNVIVRQLRPPLLGLIDFGDMHEGLTVSEPAIAAAYALLGKADPLAAAAQLVRGYHLQNHLTEEEIAALFPLIAMRLAVSVVNSARRKALKGGDPYVTVSEAPAWSALEKLIHIHPRFAEYTFRHACGLPPVAKSTRVVAWLKEQSVSLSSVLEIHLRTAPVKVFDLSISSTFLGADPQSVQTDVLSEAIFREMQRAGVVAGIGRYDEARGIYNAAQFAPSANPTDERRTIHLGIDVFVEPGMLIRAPLAGEIYLVTRNRALLDYGPLVILKHRTDAGDEFFTLYGHLMASSTTQLRPGQKIAAGEAFARVGGIDENGGWPPHLHLQIIVDLLELEADFPGVALPSQREVWKSLCPDPNVLLGIPADRLPPAERDWANLLVERYGLIGGNLRLSYEKPLKIVRGWKQYLYDDTGRSYLDVYNNVPLVGHSHPRVVRAVQEQIALLNTNTRYMHENIIRYAARLTELLPDPLRVCYFVNSGSEANELALRLARTHTGREDVIVLEHAYHGHTTTLIDVSPYKFNGPGGTGRKPWVHVAPLADDYRGPYRRDDPQAGAKYAEHVAEILAQTNSEGRQVAAYLAETLPSVGGQIVFPPHYLAETYEHVRRAGAVCIADEVQVGFGRLGTHFWGFETQNVAPDIVVFGKPIGNAFPLAAVVTTEAIARSFDNGMEFFSTFGGNPVACAAGLAVLDVLQEENLQENARIVGDFLKTGLERLQEKHQIIGDVRGLGLFLGVDLVVDRETRAPATAQASYVANRLRDRGILTGTDGPHHNVIKLRPPLIFSRGDADLFLDTLDSVLDEDAAQP